MYLCTHPPVRIAFDNIDHSIICCGIRFMYPINRLQEHRSLVVFVIWPQKIVYVLRVKIWAYEKLPLVDSVSILHKKPLLRRAGDPSEHIGNEFRTTRLDVDQNLGVIEYVEEGDEIVHKWLSARDTHT